MNYNGIQSPIYRGGNDFTVSNTDVKFNRETGNVKTTHGISLNVDTKKLANFGGGYRIESIPEGLKIEQRGKDAGHFEIMPAYEMSLEEYQNLLNKIKITGPY